MTDETLQWKSKVIPFSLSFFNNTQNEIHSIQILYFAGQMQDKETLQKSGDLIFYGEDGKSNHTWFNSLDLRIPVSTITCGHKVLFVVKQIKEKSCSLLFKHKASKFKIHVEKIRPRGNISSQFTRKGLE